MEARYVDATAQPFDNSTQLSPSQPARSYRRFATLRWKTLLIIAATLAGLLMIVYIPLRVFLLGSFISLERQMLQTDLERALNVVADDIRGLDSFNASYATWDDTYTFVVDSNQTYIEKNYYDQFMIDNRLNLVLIVDNAGKVVFEKTFDLDTQQDVPLPQRFRQLSTHDILLSNISTTSGITGVLMLPNAPMLITARPIVTSEGRGPIRGTLMFGHYLDGKEIARLAESMHLALAVDRLDNPNLPKALLLADMSGTDRTPAFIEPVSEQVIVGYTPLRDIDMDAKLLLRVEVPRSIYAQGQIGISSFMLSFLVAGLLFGVMILALLERFVLSRLAALNTSVQSIGAQSNLSERVTMTGDDEIAHLTDSINDMLAALELAQAKHQQAEEVRKRVLIREEALHAKHEFLSIVSHELRTPLTPIAGYVDLMLLGEGGDLTDEQRQFLQTIRSNTTRMASLVEDLLDIGRLETNNITLECRPTDLKVIIAEAAKLLQPELANKQTALVLEFADTLPLVELDPKRIGQVLNNLISNAVKYSYPQATITIRVCPRDNDQIEIQVEDTGVGLTPEQQNQLFTRFYRADNQFRDTVRGSGLGLSIAKSYVELHSGAMSVSSQLSIGSIFMFTLPLRQPQLNDPPLPTQGDQ